MGGQLLVINEWIFHNIRGKNCKNCENDASGEICENCAKAQREVAHFLLVLEQNKDKITVLHGSPWMKKVYELMEKTDLHTGDPYVRTLSKLINSLIWTENKCIQKTKWDIAAAAIPQDAIAAAPQEDIYLIQLYYAAQADMIITTDHKFYDAFASRPDLGVNIILRDNFVPDYLQQN